MDILDFDGFSSFSKIAASSVCHEVIDERGCVYKDPLYTKEKQRMSNKPATILNPPKIR